MTIYLYFLKIGGGGGILFLLLLLCCVVLSCFVFVVVFFVNFQTVLEVQNALKDKKNVYFNQAMQNVRKLAVKITFPSIEQTENTPLFFLFFFFFLSFQIIEITFSLLCFLLVARL